MPEEIRKITYKFVSPSVPAPLLKSDASRRTSGPARRTSVYDRQEREKASSQYTHLLFGAAASLMAGTELATDRRDFVDDRGTDQLLGALERSEFKLEYQPIVPLTPRGTFGVEALVRWAVPGESVVMPGQFVPKAEEHGSIVALGNWIFEEACAQFARWTKAKVDPGIDWISINLSPRQLHSDGTADVFVEAVRRTAVDPAKITLEVTESSILDDRPEIWRQLDRLRQVGMRVALDDFGTRYSMLSHLQHSAVDAVKVDRSFIAELATEGRNRTIVESVISLSHDLGLTVVAEGVETAAELKAVRALGADYAQGYHFSRPADPGRMARAIRRLRTVV